MTDNGLPGNTVRELRGYLWLTTVNGLVRFEGVRLTVFDKNNSPAFPGNRCHPLLEDRAGNLWIGAEDAGLVRYQPVFRT
jgi:ligand-binding sensor domain-containing protein